MNRRAYLIAVVNAEIRAKLIIDRFEKELGVNGNQNPQGSNPAAGQTNNAQGNVPNNAPAPQQPVYGG